MTMFTLSARAVYPGGSRGAVFARHVSSSPLGCLVAMAAAVARWMPPWRHADAGRLPQAIEFRLAWRDEETVLGDRPGRPRSGTGVAARRRGRVRERRRRAARTGGSGGPSQSPCPDPVPGADPVRRAAEA